ncbi:hypothetical protein RV01_GL000474 [Enterococcus dispar]|jgi:hypothetical protein|nr:hypothetical protein RV01_GL000474 [Enterococcus dispar]
MWIPATFMALVFFLSNKKVILPPFTIFYRIYMAFLEKYFIFIYKKMKNNCITFRNDKIFLKGHKIVFTAFLTFRIKII